MHCLVMALLAINTDSTHTVHNTDELANALRTVGT
jgi:hypothetical protein